MLTTMKAAAVTVALLAATVPSASTATKSRPAAAVGAAAAVATPGALDKADLVDALRDFVESGMTDTSMLPLKPGVAAGWAEEQSVVMAYVGGTSQIVFPSSVWLARVPEANDPTDPGNRIRSLFAAASFDGRPHYIEVTLSLTQAAGEWRHMVAGLAVIWGKGLQGLPDDHGWASLPKVSAS